MSATEYKANLEDLHFILFDQLQIHEEFAKYPKYAEFDRDIYVDAIGEAVKLAEEVLHPVNISGDKEGVRLEDGQVYTPEGYKEAWTTVAEGGWIGVSLPEEHGGIGLPLPIGMVMQEVFSGSAMGFAIYLGLTGAAARVIIHFGSEELKQTYVERMLTGEWAGTMLLTEAGAGSAVGDSRTKATPSDEPGVYLLEGEKIFISGGDQDMTDNIVHLALARTPDSPPGTKGLSLFVVPKYLVNEDGELGERNDIRVVGVEHKMGIHGSSTCTLAMGAEGPCRGWLLGEEHQGIKLMFKMMNEARIGVGAQGVGVSGAAWEYALSYAKDRIQGVDLGQLKDPDAPGVPIIQHPDVRRMLMTIRCQTEAMRSLLYRMAFYADIAENSQDAKRAASLFDKVDLLVPILKAHGSDLGFDLSAMALQVFGGYGYIAEYPIEQLVRDAKIASIYEGTNGIQAMDLLGRKMRIKGGALYMGWMQEANKLVARGKKAGFEAEAGALGKAIGHLGATAMFLGQLGLKGDLHAAMFHAYPFLRMFGMVVLGLESLDQALVAKDKIEAEAETPFLKAKLANLKFYVNYLLPPAIGLGKAIQSGDRSALEDDLWPIE